MYNGNCSFKYNNIPGIPVIDIPVPFNPRIAANQPPIPPPKQPHTKGLTNLKFTPNTAGSVIPNKADTEDGYASD